MELRQLRQFVALSEALNFHRAAEALNMTQPPLSLSIRKLEAELGGPLFERHARGVTLTGPAVAALAQAREALRAAEAMAEAFREAAGGERGQLRVGFVGSVTYGLLPAIVTRFRERHPKVHLRLKEATSLDVVRGLGEGTLDVGLIRTPLLQAAAVSLTPLYKEELILMTPPGHRLADAGQVRLEELQEEDFVVYDRVQVPGLWTQTIMACEAAGFLPRIAEEAAQIHTLIALVESGLGVALAPAVMRRAAAGRVQCLSLTAGGAPLQIGLALATREGTRNHAVQAFAATASEAAAAI
ncbi:MAG: transcriptional regulator, LysR family [Phenylobacterium sp.]|nr:transcriptional regulator, LysR family [Phenylobacterium sp.]